MSPDTIYNGGFISAQTLHNTFVYRMNQLMVDVCPPGTPNRQKILDHFDGIRCELMTKATEMPAAQAPRPPPPQPKPGAPIDMPPTDSRDELRNYQARIRRT